MLGFPCGSNGKGSAYHARDPGSTPGSWGQEEKGTTDEMAQWHHRLDGREVE